MAEEFDLSEKICNRQGIQIVKAYDEEDIKEFIRRLHEEIHSAKDMPRTTKAEIHTLDWVDKLIDKLAGSKLV